MKVILFHVTHVSRILITSCTHLLSMQVTISGSGRISIVKLKVMVLLEREHILYSGPSLRRYFSRFTEVKFISSDSSDVLSTDRSLIVSSGQLLLATLEI